MQVFRDYLLTLFVGDPVALFRDYLLTLFVGDPVGRCFRLSRSILAAHDFCFIQIPHSGKPCSGLS